MVRGTNASGDNNKGKEAVTDSNRPLHPSLTKSDLPGTWPPLSHNSSTPVPSTSRQQQAYNSIRLSSDGSDTSTTTMYAITNSPPSVLSSTNPFQRRPDSNPFRRTSGVGSDAALQAELDALNKQEKEDQESREIAMKLDRDERMRIEKELTRANYDSWKEKGKRGTHDTSQSSATGGALKYSDVTSTAGKYASKIMSFGRGGASGSASASASSAQYVSHGDLPATPSQNHGHGNHGASGSSRATPAELGESASTPKRFDQTSPGSRKRVEDETRNMELAYRLQMEDQRQVPRGVSTVFVISPGLYLS